jgi:hypothetical protein
VAQVLLCAPVTVSTRLFRVDRVGGGGPQQDSDGDGGRFMAGLEVREMRCGDADLGDPSDSDGGANFRIVRREVVPPAEAVAGRRSRRQRYPTTATIAADTHRIDTRHGTNIATLAAARKLLTLVCYWLRAGHIRALD